MFAATEDTPNKVLNDVKSGRVDPKLLLTASRSSLARKEFDQAEKFAKSADKNSSLLTFPIWGDTPSSALKDIAQARISAPRMVTKAAPEPKAAPTTLPPAPKMADGRPVPNMPVSESANKDSDESRVLIRKARAALTANKIDEAKKFTAMARAKKPNLSFWEDNPERLDSDIRRTEGRTKTPSPIVQTGATAPAGPDLPGPNATATPTPVAPRTKEEAKGLLAVGRRQLAEGKLDEASQTTQRIKSSTTVSWGLFEDSPDRLGIDIEKVRVKLDRQESERLTVEGRKAYDKRDYEAATRFAYRAQKLHGNYSIWDLGDQPNKLLSDIQTAQGKLRQTALPPAAVVRRETKGITPTPPATGPTGVAKATPPVVPEQKPATPPKPWSEVATNTMPGLPGVDSMAGTVPPTSEKPTPDKLKAMQLVAEAQRMRKEGKSLVVAQAKAMEAQKIGATFTTDEVSPDTVYQQIAVDIRNGIDSMMRQSYDTVMYGKGDLATRYRDAETKLDLARQMAQASGQDVQPIEQRLAQVRNLKAGKVAERPETAVVQATPGLGTSSDGLATPASVTPTVEEKMVEQARGELRRGEVATARRLAEQAMIGAQKGQPSVRDQAASLLRTIDAEEFNQKKLGTERAFEAAMAAFRRREYGRSSAVIASLDLRMLNVEQQGRLREISLTPEMATGAAMARQGTSATPNGSATPTAGKTGPTTGIVRTAVSGQASPNPVPGALALNTTGDLPPVSAPGKGTASDSGDGGLLDQHKARQQILMDKLRRDAIEVQREASDKFRAGQQDEAMEKLQDFLTVLNEEKLESNQVSGLRRPIESRLSSYRLMKAQSDLSAGRVASRLNGQERVNASRKAEELKLKNVEKLMKDFNDAIKAAKYVEAEGYASRVLEIDPDNTAAGAGVTIARMQRRVNDAKGLKDRKEQMNLELLNTAEDPGSTDAITKGVGFNKERWNQAKGRTPLSAIEQGRPTPAEKAIERSMLTPINISFENTPLKSVLDELRDMHAINIVPDMQALNEAGVHLESPITMKLERIALKSALNLILHQVKLTYIIKDDVLQITTQEHAQGKQRRWTYPVADLVIPIENGTPSKTPFDRPNAAANAAGTTTPYSGPNGMAGGAPVGTSSSSSQGSSGSSLPTGNNGGGTNATKNRRANTQEEQLIQLITRSIATRTWSDMGGQATIEYHPMTMALIVNQTTDIHEQIQDLLASLRRLQDQEVAVEVRFISVTEDFFERIGVNFNVNILADKSNRRFEPGLLSNNFVSDPTRFINGFNPGNFLAGLTPAGTLTPDLNIPITNNSFLQAIPTFGGYAPGGGLSLGLAFLSDIQVFLFMEAVQGDTRANVMQAPKLTMFNGQTATLNVSEDQNYLTGIQLTNVAGTGQYAFVPQFQAFPNQSVFLTIAPVISSDRRFVRINLQPSLTNIVPSTVQAQVPIAVPIFTANDTGLGSGQPILVTQYVQTPAFTTVSVDTTVVVPDGGTVVMGGLKRLAESRNEFGPPILSKIPYINRLFKNVGYGRTTESLLIMVTPRIIIQEEEETIQTGFRTQSFAGN